MKIIKKEQEKEKSEDAEISKDGSVQGKEMSVESTPQGQRPRNKRPPSAPPTATKSIKPKEPGSSENIESLSEESSKKSKPAKKEKKDRSFIDFVNDLVKIFEKA